MSELIVHHLPSAWGLPSVSPFCLKLDTYLRIVGLPFTAVIDKVPFGAPKKKLPYIEHSGRRIGDSTLAIDYLEGEFGVDGNAGLSAGQRAVALALQRLLEENLYWVMVYDRWMVDANWQFFRDIVLGGMPLPVRRLALYLEESLYRGLQWAVFEPNDEPLWGQIRQTVRGFLQDLYRQGAFAGTSPRQAYFVKCDRETTTAGDVERGVVNIVVGYAPVRPAEFVIIKLQQLAGQASG